eukprot:scaffold2324_cov163-Ochromonas_danica.AAC.17
MRWLCWLFLTLPVTEHLVAFPSSLPLFRRRPSRLSLCSTSEKPNNLFNDDALLEPMHSASYDILEHPTEEMRERDLEDLLRQRAMRFYDRQLIRTQEKCYLVGLEERKTAASSVLLQPIERVPSSKEDEKLLSFSLEESLTELSELAGAAGLTVVGSTYQRLTTPNVEYYIGPGKVKEITEQMHRLGCSCLVVDTELSPSQQKNLEAAFNKDLLKKEQQRGSGSGSGSGSGRNGQLQVELALLSYRLPRLTNMWSHLERQSSGSKGRSNGGVGLRGPGEKQLESDRRQMKKQIAALKKEIEEVRGHRSRHRQRRRGLGLPVLAIVVRLPPPPPPLACSSYCCHFSIGKSTLLNAFTSSTTSEQLDSSPTANTAAVSGSPQAQRIAQRRGDYQEWRSAEEEAEEGKKVFVADMVFATLDPSTRLVPGACLTHKETLTRDSNNDDDDGEEQEQKTQRLPDILMTDTVGFVQKLPTHLVAAFRATLEEIGEADLLLVRLV